MADKDLPALLRYRCSWREFSPYLLRSRPPVHYQDYGTREEADARKHELQAGPGIVACVTEVTPRGNLGSAKIGKGAAPCATMPLFPE